MTRDQWACKFCNAVNHEMDAECQFCDVIDPANHACESVTTPDGHGAYCAHCGTVLA